MVADHFATVLRNKLGFEVCGRAADARGGLRLVRDEQPDLVIVDLTLAQGHGLELLKDMRCLPHPPKALVVSGHDESVFVQRALNAGAMGYVMKAHDTAVLVDAVRCVMGGNTYLSREAMTLLLRQNRSPSAVADLTDREVQVLEGLGRGRDTKQIAAFLGIDAGTVETYRTRLRSKLGMRSIEALRMYAFHWVHLGERVTPQAGTASASPPPPGVKARPRASPRGPSGSAR